MTILETFRKRLAATIYAAGSPTPQTRIVGGGSEDNPFARLGRDDRTDPRAKIKRFMKNYRRGGPVADALDAYPLFALANGYELVCEKGSEALKDKVITWCDQPQVDLDSTLWDGILSAIIAGDGYQEIIQDRGGGVWGIVTRDPASFRKKYDEFGRLQYYEQVMETLGIEKPVQIEPDRILNLILFRAPGDVYGQSIMDRAEDDINRDLDVIESITKAIHRHGTPKQQWAVGGDENRASDADLKAIRTEIQTMKAMTDFATTHDVKVNMLDTAGVQNVDVYSNVSLQRLACALGVPEEMLGLGRGSTEATAVVRMKAFLDRISTIQGIVARAYSRGLIDRITGAPGAVWIEFNDTSVEDEKKVADLIAVLAKLDQFDPWAVVTPEWVRERMKIEAPATEPQVDVSPYQVGASPYQGDTGAGGQTS